MKQTNPKRKRMQRALIRLENTLASGVKRSKDGKNKLPLTTSDTSRINKEIKVLTSKLV